jgi:hypothetical protein
MLWKNKYTEMRKYKRYRCSLPVEYSIYSYKISTGKSKLKNVSQGGLLLSMTHPPLPEAVIAIHLDAKKLMRYVDFTQILVDADGNPIARVVWVKEERGKSKRYDVAVRFLEKPFPVKKELLS